MKCVATDLLVVGGGPAGMSAAIAAARAGIRCILVERASALRLILLDPMGGNPKRDKPATVSDRLQWRIPVGDRWRGMRPGPAHHLSQPVEVHGVCRGKHSRTRLAVDAARFVTPTT